MDLSTPSFIFGFSLDLTAHWDRHAWFMFTIWIVLVPSIVVATRFGKPRPSPEGIPKGSPKFGRKLWWFTLHRVGLFLLTLASLAGGLLAVVASGGSSTSFHAFFGFATIVAGLLQLLSARLRGTHGGRDPSISSSGRAAYVRGDHYDMTPRRRWFEACHKTFGYFTIVFAFGAVATGLCQHWIAAIAICLALAIAILASVAVVLEARGLRHDTYLSNFGTGARHPYNKARIDELSGE